MKNLATALFVLSLLAGCGKEESYGSSGGSSSGSGVFINGRELSASQVEEMKKRYGRDPVKGNFWYDAKSGLCGTVGHSASGFMYPDHDFGPLDEKASSGSTGVFLNGRELPREEYLFFSELSGNLIPQGRYWMDKQGNAGAEGNPYPSGNLYVAVAQRRQRGGGAPGGQKDNFWWSRFSAGNYNEDNSAGYISLPGGGFATYGM